VSITDRASGDAVDAVLDTDFPLVRLVDAEVSWSPYRLQAIRRYLTSGLSGPLPQHCHWSWAQKALTFEPAVHAVFAIEAANEVQGLMWLCLRDYRARLAPDFGKSLVYVNYLESAPWNTREYTADTRFKGVGTLLLEAAVLRSRKDGFEGRIGLHALPQSEAFYSGACGMCKLGIDAADGDLTYFEFTSAAATAFVSG
jgi:hypothetical protein